jgi:hypothetical protein
MHSPTSLSPSPSRTAATAAPPREAGSNFLGFLPLRELFSLDVRSLALFRVGLALMVFLDWFDRIPDLRIHYSDEGIVPRDLIPGIQPFSLHMFSGSTWFQAVLCAVALVFSLLLLVGYRTSLASLVSWSLIAGVHGRMPPLMQGGDHVIRMLLFWSIFLPLGACWSIDSARQGNSASAGRRRTAVLSLGTVAYLVQLCLIYWYASAWKWAPEWRKDGTAVYLSLQAEYFTTRVARFLLGYPELLRVLTFCTLWLEALGPAVLFFPFSVTWQRLLVASAFILFHVGLALNLELGNFPWVCVVAWLAILPGALWDRIEAQLRDPEVARLTLYHATPRPGLLAWLRTFLFLGDARLAPAWDDPALLARLRGHGSWCVVDGGGAEHYGADALALLVGHSCVFWPLAGLFRFRAARWLGERLARVLPGPGSHRAAPPDGATPPPWAPPGGPVGNAVLLFFLIWVVLYNVRTFGVGASEFKPLPYLGVDFKGQTTVVEYVDPNSPAQTAKLQVGDELEQMGDYKVHAPNDVGEQLLSHSPGEEVRIILRRQGKEVALNVKLGAKPGVDRWQWIFPDKAMQIGIVLGLEQGWGLFAPRPGKDVGWHLVIGTTVKGVEMDLITGRPLDRSKPELLAATYANNRWRKLMMNLSAPRYYPYLPPAAAVYYYNHWNETHGPDEQLFAADIVYMREQSRPPGETRPPVEPVLVYRYLPGAEAK